MTNAQRQSLEDAIERYADARALEDAMETSGGKLVASRATTRARDVIDAWIDVIHEATEHVPRDVSVGERF